MDKFGLIEWFRGESAAPLTEEHALKLAESLFRTMIVIASDRSMLRAGSSSERRPFMQL